MLQQNALLDQRTWAYGRESFKCHGIGARQIENQLQHDDFTGKAHTLYSLRHTAICMRIINSHGKVNIFNLAKNAGTSVASL